MPMSPNVFDAMLVTQTESTVNRMADFKSLEAAGFTAGGKSADQAKAEEAREAADEQRRVMLRGIMSMEARERLNRVAIVKPENARAVEEHLIRLARSGKLTAKVSEDDLVRILEEVTRVSAGGAGVTKKITITRKKRADEEDDDDDDL